jgi:hypothetical protein
VVRCELVFVLNLPILPDRDLSVGVPHDEIRILSGGDDPLGAEADDRGGAGAPNLCGRGGGNDRVRRRTRRSRVDTELKIYQGLLQVTDTKCRRDFRLNRGLNDV